MKKNVKYIFLFVIFLSSISFFVWFMYQNSERSRASDNCEELTDIEPNNDYAGALNNGIMCLENLAGNLNNDSDFYHLYVGADSNIYISLTNNTNGRIRMGVEKIVNQGYTSIYNSLGISSDKTSAYNFTLTQGEYILIIQNELPNIEGEYVLQIDDEPHLSDQPRTLIVCPNNDNIVAIGRDGCHFGNSDPENNGEAIQEAISAAAEGDTVYIKNGIYKYSAGNMRPIGSTLHPPKNISIIGESIDNTQLQFSLTIAYSNVLIADLTINGSNTPPGANCLILTGNQGTGGGTVGTNYIVRDVGTGNCKSNNIYIQGYPTVLIEANRIFGSVFADSGVITIRNSSFKSGPPTYKDTILLNGLRDITASIENNVFYENTGGSIRVYEDGSEVNINIRNNIFFNPSGGSAIRFEGQPNISASYNLFWMFPDISCPTNANLCTSEGSLIRVNPGFVNTAINDYHLLSSSPAINAGDPAILDPDGSRSDIGVYGGPGACSLDPSLPGCQTDSTPEPTTIPPSPTAPPLPQEYYYMRQSFISEDGSKSWYRDCPNDLQSGIKSNECSQWIGPIFMNDIALPSGGTNPRIRDVVNYSYSQNGTFIHHQGLISYDGTKAWTRKCTMQTSGSFGECTTWLGPILYSDMTLPGLTGDLKVRGQADVTYVKNGVLYLRQQILEYTGNRAWQRDCPFNQDRSINMENCSDWSQPQTFSALNLPGNNDPGKIGSISLSTYFKENKQWYRQTFISYDGATAWFKDCEINATQGITDQCTTNYETPIDLLALNLPSHEEGTFAGFGTFEYYTNAPISPAVPQCTRHSEGDADCDGDIDNNDYEIWRREFLGETAGTRSDFNNDNRISPLDYEIWRSTRFDQ